VPKANTTSALEINSIAAFDPLYPRGPTAKGWLPGKLSLCWYPEQTGESNFSAIDIFTCGQNMMPELASQYFIESLMAKEHSLRVIERNPPSAVSKQIRTVV